MGSKNIRMIIIIIIMIIIFKKIIIKVNGPVLARVLELARLNAFLKKIVNVFGKNSHY